MSKKNNNSNFISVIVPVYNEEKNIRFLIERLLCLNYPKNKYEIIIVDNNSEDKTAEIIKEFQVVYLCEKKQSSYAVRNKGIKESKGDILAFIDGDCIPDKDWLKNAITHFINEDVDIIAGNIILSDNGDSNNYLVKLYQLLKMGERNKNSEREGKCSGGNLIVKRKVFRKVGLFDEGLISGGDVEWTKRATNNEFKLKYYKDVVTRHPYENIQSLFKRAIRIGYGKIFILYLGNKSSILFLHKDKEKKQKNILSQIVRIYYNSINIFCKKYRQKKINLMNLVLLVLISFLLQSATFFGIIKGFLEIRLFRKHKLNEKKDDIFN